MKTQKIDTSTIPSRADLLTKLTPEQIRLWLSYLLQDLTIKYRRGGWYIFTYDGKERKMQRTEVADFLTKRLVEVADARENGQNFPDPFARAKELDKAKHLKKEPEKEQTNGYPPAWASDAMKEAYVWLADVDNLSESGWNIIAAIDAEIKQLTELKELMIKAAGGFGTFRNV